MIPNWSSATMPIMYIRATKLIPVEDAAETSGGTEPLWVYTTAVLNGVTLAPDKFDITALLIINRRADH